MAQGSIRGEGSKTSQEESLSVQSSKVDKRVCARVEFMYDSCT